MIGLKNECLLLLFGPVRLSCKKTQHCRTVSYKFNENSYKHKYKCNLPKMKQIAKAKKTFS